jgi:hypothetical protein
MSFCPMNPNASSPWPLPMKPIFRLLPVLLLVASITSGCVMYPGIPGSGTIVSETRAVEGFKSVSVGGSGTLRITQGDTESLEVEADDNLLPYLRTEVSGGELKIWWERGNLRFTKSPVYTLGVRRLERVHLSGSLQAQMDRLTTEKFAGHISGSGKIELGQLEAGEVKMRISGSGELSIEQGRGDSLDVGISGSGNARMAGFEVKDVEVSISGSGNAEIHAVNSLDASVSGSGNVTYVGSPKVNSSVSGSGRVRSKQK